MKVHFSLELLLILCCLPTLFGLKTHDWKTCSQSAFCRRGRALSGRAKEAGKEWRSPYSIDPASVEVASDTATFSAAVKSVLYPEIKFKLDLQVLQDGVVRVRMDEVDGLRKRYDEAASWALISDPKVSNEVQWVVGTKDIRATYGEKKDITVVVEFNPLKVSMLRAGKEEIVLNGKGLLHMEHFRTKEEPKAEKIPEEGLDEDDAQQVMDMNPANTWFEGEPDGWWEEKFSTWTDSKPKGPAFDFSNSKSLFKLMCIMKVRNHFPSISTSLATDMCTVYLSMRQALICLRQLAKNLSSTNLTDYTMQMSSNTLLPRPCRYMVLSHLCTHIRQRPL